MRKKIYFCFGKNLMERHYITTNETKEMVDVKVQSVNEKFELEKIISF